MRLLITAGGTGGHVYPALAVASELPPGTPVLWIGTAKGMEGELVTREGIKFESVQAGAVVGVGALGAMWGLARLAWGAAQAARLVMHFRPDALFVTGGYTAIPVALVCWLARVPILVYLPDIEPGSAVRLVARFAAKVAVTTEASRAYFPIEKIVVTGYPLRPALLRAAAERERARSHFALAEGRPTVLVFGGSRGARSINLTLLNVLDDLLADFEIIHVTGQLDWLAVAGRRARMSEEQRLHYHAFAYLHDDMGLAFAAADVVVCRSGASVLGELPMFGLGAILVPYPHAWRYQKVNADYLAERGAAVRLNDDELKMKLSATIRELLGDATRLQAMQAASRALAVPDASRRIAAELLQLASGTESARP